VSILRKRGYLSEAITVGGVEDSLEIVIKKMRILVDRTKDVPNLALRLKRVLNDKSSEMLVLANKISGKKTFFQKIRGY
jgi:hypothetical protein